MVQTRDQVRAKSSLIILFPFQHPRSPTPRHRHRVSPAGPGRPQPLWPPGDWLRHIRIVGEWQKSNDSDDYGDYIMLVRAPSWPEETWSSRTTPRRSTAEWPSCSTGRCWTIIIIILWPNDLFITNPLIDWDWLWNFIEFKTSEL